MRVAALVACWVAVVADDCVVELQEESMLGKSDSDNICSPKTAEKIEDPTEKKNAMCFFECMKEYKIKKFNSSSLKMIPSVQNCSSDPTYQCETTWLQCNTSTDAFPNACSGKVNASDGETALAFYSYSAERWSKIGHYQKVLELNWVPQAQIFVRQAFCSAFYRIRKVNFNCLGQFNEAESWTPTQVLPPAALEPYPNNYVAPTFDDEIQVLGPYWMRKCYIGQQSGPVHKMHGCQPEDLEEIKKEDVEIEGNLSLCLGSIFAYDIRWHIDEGVNLAVAQYPWIEKYEGCPHIPLKCAKPVNEFPNACSGTFKLKDKKFWIALWSYKDETWTKMLRKVVVDKQISCDANLRLRSSSALFKEVTGDVRFPPAPPKMDDCPQTFAPLVGRLIPTTTTDTSTTPVDTSTTPAGTTSAERTTAEETTTPNETPENPDDEKPEESQDDKKPEENQDDKKPENQDDKKPEEPKDKKSEGSIWPKVIIGVLVIGAVAAAAFYFRNTGANQEQQRLREVELRERS